MRSVVVSAKSVDEFARGVSAPNITLLNIIDQSQVTPLGEFMIGLAGIGLKLGNQRNEN